jgi:hypothetical protein
MQPSASGAFRPPTAAAAAAVTPVPAAAARRAAFPATPRRCIMGARRSRAAEPLTAIADDAAAAGASGADGQFADAAAYARAVADDEGRDKHVE